jgi:flavin reductase (DIM6/NTAB) family NADH-FMN oxidoreductase RutF
LRHPILKEKFISQAYTLWNLENLLLTAGDFAAGKFNTMTVGWGSFGCMWNRPVAMVVVRPVRFTYQFMEQYDTFTLTAFPAKYASAIDLLGTRSGRDGDKIAESGLHPVAAAMVAAPTFQEAELVVECRKIYRTDFNPKDFVDPSIEKHYPRKDYHRVYFGEILSIEGEDRFNS